MDQDNNGGGEIEGGELGEENDDVDDEVEALEEEDK